VSQKPVLRSEDVWAALKDVLDPELPISIVDMGLVYDVRVRGRAAELDVTFTATACPCMDFILTDIRTRLLQEPAIDDVKINIVWDPPWTNERLTPEGRQLLRAFGVSA
jgi:metal-sulfur cluster biosynthetic enzyme